MLRKITRNGQVSALKKVLLEFHLKAGDYLDIESSKSAIRIKPVTVSELSPREYEKLAAKFPAAKKSYIIENYMAEKRKKREEEPEETTKKVQELAKKAFKALSCEDYSRVDMFLKKNGDILINEINTIPGFTHISMFPQLWTLTGMTYTQLITKLISFSLERHQQTLRIKRDYDSAL